MSKIYFLLFFVLNILNQLHATNYSLSTLNTETISEVDNWNAGSHFGINDQEQIFGTCLFNNKHTIYFIDNPKKTIKFIQRSEENLNPISMNNLGQITGYTTENGKYHSLFLWENDLGIKKINIFNSHYVIPIALNDHNQIIGRYTSSDDTVRPFLWNNGSAIDMGLNSAFARQFESCGYNLTSINLSDINNNGDIIGVAIFGKYNEQTKKYVSVESFPFYWDGEFHIIPVPLTFHFSPNRIKLNINGIVLISFSNSITYIWNKKNGLQILNNFKSSIINDENTIIGYDAFWTGDKSITFSQLLNVNDIHNMAPPYSENYSIEKLGFLGPGYSIERMTSINNNGQILCMGYIWGVWHPCIINPANERAVR